jgi:hypothetical protein
LRPSLNRPAYGLLIQRSAAEASFQALGLFPSVFPVRRLAAAALGLLDASTSKQQQLQQLLKRIRPARLRGKVALAVAVVGSAIGASENGCHLKFQVAVD